MVRGKSCKYKFLWQILTDGNHDEGVLLAQDFIDNMVKVKCVSERLIVVKVVIGECLIKVVSGYMPQ